jgi:hypothetical protein
MKFGAVQRVEQVGCDAAPLLEHLVHPAGADQAVSDVLGDELGAQVGTFGGQELGHEREVFELAGVQARRAQTVQAHNVPTAAGTTHALKLANRIIRVADGEHAGVFAGHERPGRIP